MSSYRPTLEDIVSLCKRRGFVFQSAEIYGGLNGVYDFGPLGTINQKQSSQHVDKVNHIT